MSCSCVIGTRLFNNKMVVNTIECVLRYQFIIQYFVQACSKSIIFLTKSNQSNILLIELTINYYQYPSMFNYGDETNLDETIIIHKVQQLTTDDTGTINIADAIEHLQPNVHGL